MAKKRIFVSFDFDNDKKLKDFIIAQSRLLEVIVIFPRISGHQVKNDNLNSRRCSNGKETK